MPNNPWKVYFFVMCIFSTWTFIPFDFTVKNALASNLTVIGLAGLYGFAFRVPIGRLGFWKIFAILKLGAHLIVLISVITSLSVDAELEHMGSAGLVLVVLLVELPLVYALVIYAKKSAAIWQQVTPERTDT